MDEDKFQEMREIEIARLMENNEPRKIKTLLGEVSVDKKPIEPNPELLSDEEILIYAPDSKEASKVRVKQGKGGVHDKLIIYEPFFVCAFLCFFPGIMLCLVSFWLWALLIIIVLGVSVYLLFIKDYSEVESF